VASDGYQLKMVFNTFTNLASQPLIQFARRFSYARGRLRLLSGASHEGTQNPVGWGGGLASEKGE